MLEIRPFAVEVVRFQIAVDRRMGIGAVVSQNNGLGVLQFGENLRLKYLVALQVVSFVVLIVALWAVARPVSTLTPAS